MRRTHVVSVDTDSVQLRHPERRATTDRASRADASPGLHGAASHLRTVRHWQDGDAGAGHHAAADAQPQGHRAHLHAFQQVRVVPSCVTASYM